MNARKIYVILLHSPMVNREGREVVTAVTNLDIHDIARSCKTFGIERYFIVNPEPEQERLVNTILGHWDQEVSRVHHPSRAKALEIARFSRCFEETYNDIMAENGGEKPFVVMPDAKVLPESWTYAALREKLKKGCLEEGQDSGLRPLVIVFGTGWGIAPRFYPNVDRPLSPIHREDTEADRVNIGLESPEKRKYNHLSVRAAAAIVLDRLFGI